MYSITPVKSLELILQTLQTERTSRRPSAKYFNIFSPFCLERSSHSIYLQSIDCKHNLLESSHHKHYKLHLCFIYIFDICGGSKYLAFSSSTIKCGTNKGRSRRFLWIWGHWQWRTENNTKTVPISRMAVFCFYLCTKLSEQHIFTAGIFSSHNY